MHVRTRHAADIFPLRIGIPKESLITYLRNHHAEIIRFCNERFDAADGDVFRKERVSSLRTESLADDTKNIETIWKRESFSWIW